MFEPTTLRLTLLWLLSPGAPLLAATDQPQLPPVIDSEPSITIGELLTLRDALPEISGERLSELVKEFTSNLPITIEFVPPEEVTRRKGKARPDDKADAFNQRIEKTWHVVIRNDFNRSKQAELLLHEIGHVEFDMLFEPAANAPEAVFKDHAVKSEAFALHYALRQCLLRGLNGPLVNGVIRIALLSEKHDAIDGPAARMLFPTWTWRECLIRTIKVQRQTTPSATLQP